MVPETGKRSSSPGQEDFKAMYLNLVFWKFKPYSGQPHSGASLWRWRQQGPLKCWYPVTSLHGIITQKTVTWIFITVKTSNLMCKLFVLHVRVFQHARNIQLFEVPNSYVDC